MNELDLPVIGDGGSAALLLTLLPGLVTYLVVLLLTAREKKIETAESLVKGLAYTVCVYAIWAVLSQVDWIVELPMFFVVVSIAIVFGIVASVLANTGILYSTLRWLKITEQSSWESTWYSYLKSLHGSRHQYVQVYLASGKIIYGRIKEHSHTQNAGHLYMENCEWIMKDGSCHEALGLFLIPGDEIQLIQALPSPDLLIPPSS